MGHGVSVYIDFPHKFSEWCSSFYSGVEGHFAHHPHGHGWVKMQDQTTPLLADLIGG
jgi:hypothetical protein